MKHFGTTTLVAGAAIVGAVFAAGPASAGQGLPLEPSTDAQSVMDISPSGSANSLASGSAWLPCLLGQKSTFCNYVG
ncbi:hypothetical protein DFR70_116100 [Nocardia tenerifensis]|uniref:Uncharacterized protein n=1 Tax=Nocardia tenerifensis TaxID=228006 RepID=A0A318JWE8_9NOCA|nr:hypothetical protein [Nocardia tenerifensis]PXX57870.1 hypothetical protein DFR70_116100 [Nocardia tenerifensis]